jgi:hypothetical protein
MKTIVGKITNERVCCGYSKWTMHAVHVKVLFSPSLSLFLSLTPWYLEILSPTFVTTE